jgi:uncharacterized protein
MAEDRTMPASLRKLHPAMVRGELTGNPFCGNYDYGVPFMANDGGAKAYVHTLGEALHYEFKPRGVYVTVVPPPLTNTPVLAKLGFDPRTMPMKPMSVEQCVSEGLNALRVNRSRIIPGRLHRIMNALVPASVKRTMTAKMLGKTLANKPAIAKSARESIDVRVR